MHRTLVVVAALVGCTQAPQEPLRPLAGATSSASATSSSTAPAPFHCFSWVHGHEHSTDCFRSHETCESERLAMERGARPTTPCQGLPGASCTMVSRPPEHPVPRERCFSNAGACARYRAFVLGNELTVTPCEDR